MISLIIGGIVLAAGAIGGARAGYKQAEAQKAQMENQEKIARNQNFKNINDYNTQIGNMTQAQNLNAFLSASNSILQNKNDFKQLSDYAAQGMQAKGQSTASAAMTGFRNTGTIKTSQDITNSNIQRDYGMQKNRVISAASQRYLSSRLSYLDVESQKGQMADDLSFNRSSAQSKVQLLKEGRESINPWEEALWGGLSGGASAANPAYFID